MPELKTQKKTTRPKAKPTTKTTSPNPSESFLSWYEIPVLNLERAMHFYANVFSISFETTTTSLHAMAFFPAGQGVRGALVFGDGCIPSQSGALLYLDAGPGLNQAIEKVAAHGGQVLMGKTLISEEFGHYALILDSEGNRLALYSRPNKKA